MSESGFGIRQILAGVLAIYVIAVVIANSETVNVNFIFFSADAALFVALLLVGALGFVIGFFARDSYKKRSTED